MMVLIKQEEGRSPMVIIETEIFTELVTELMDDDEYSALQKYMVENPKEGGCHPRYRRNQEAPLESRQER
jgi:hypothetical protein